MEVPTAHGRGNASPLLGYAFTAHCPLPTAHSSMLAPHRAGGETKESDSGRVETGIESGDFDLGLDEPEPTQDSD